MTSPSRRQLLAMAAALGAGAAWAGSSVAASRLAWREQRELYPEGVASGDPDSSSVLLWTRRPPHKKRADKLRVEVAEADPARAGQYRLDGFTKASRLSFLLWDTAPDEELLSLAASGAIHDEATLKDQAQRMVASPRLRDGARAVRPDGAIAHV